MKKKKKEQIKKLLETEFALVAAIDLYFKKHSAKTIEEEARVLNIDECIYELINDSFVVREMIK